MLGTLVFMDGISPVRFPIKHKQILLHLVYCISSGMVYKKIIFKKTLTFYLTQASVSTYIVYNENKWSRSDLKKKEFNLSMLYLFLIGLDFFFRLKCHLDDLNCNWEDYVSKIFLFFFQTRISTIIAFYTIYWRHTQNIHQLLIKYIFFTLQKKFDLSSLLKIGKKYWLSRSKGFFKE